MAPQGPAIIPADCYSYGNAAQLIVQSIGYDAALLCPPDGPFSQACSVLTSCLSANSITGTGDRSVNTLLASADDFCSGDTSVRNSLYRASACCRNDTGLNAILSCTTTINTAACNAFINATTISDFVYSLSPPPLTQSVSSNTVASTNSTSTISSTVLASASPTSSAPASDLGTNQRSSNNVRVIVGATVGSVLGVVFLAAALAVYLYRKRKRRNSLGLQPEKAQLHSDHIKPDYKELPGPDVRRVHTVGGLEELEGSTSATDRSRLLELPTDESSVLDTTGNSLDATKDISSGNT